MSRQETILTVFVASPSDVNEERNRLEEVIRELNTAWARDLTIRLELVRWETHAYPSFGEDAQAVINEQIPNDYDLFIGLMWYRFGTPTGRAGSGTVEEFKRAKERFDRDSSALQLMMYFKDEPVAISKLDPAQLSKVNEFKASLGAEGSLYWKFTSLEQFEKLVRLHLTRYVQDWRSRHSIQSQSENRVETLSVVTQKTNVAEVVLDNELGFLDLLEQYEDEFATLNEIVERIATATTDVGEKMQTRTTEIEMAAESVDRNAAKRIITKAAVDMDQYVHRMESEIPLFSSTFNRGINALIQLVEISIDFQLEGEDFEQVQDNIRSIQKLCNTLTNVEGQIDYFRQAVVGLPRMTTKLNRAKRSVANVLKQLIDEFRSSQTLLKEAETSFTKVLETDNKLPITSVTPPTLPSSTIASTNDNIPERESWLWQNQEALASVNRGIQQAKEGEGKSLGDFSAYAELEIED